MDPTATPPRPRRRAARAGGAQVSDEELRSVALRLPLLFHAARANGGPSPEEIKSLVCGDGALAPRHFNALGQVLAEGPMSVTALGARLGVALPTASLLVAELSRAGLLERVEDDEDRRRTIVRVAPDRAGVIERFLTRRVDPLRRALDRLTGAERAAFVRALDVLTEELGGVTAGCAQPPREAARSVPAWSPTIPSEAV